MLAPSVDSGFGCKVGLYLLSTGSEQEVQMSPPIEKLSGEQAESKRGLWILLILIGIYRHILVNGVWRVGCLELRGDPSLP